jgi:hypothetical protein
LLAIDDDRSLVDDLAARGSRGGCVVESDDCLGASEATVPIFSTSPSGGFSCVDLRITPSFLWCCSRRIRMRIVSGSDDSLAAVANSAAARSCSSLAATGLERLVSTAALRACVWA